MSEHEDLKLAEGVLRREPGAFEEFYRRHAGAVYAFAMRRLRSAEAAEEAAQETFVRALKSLEGYRGEAPLGAWLLGIARRAVPASAAESVGVPAGFDLAAAPVESLGLGNAETRELVELALGSLSDKERRALVGYYGRGRSIEEVAGRERMSAAAAHSMLQRARDKFKTAFERIAGEGLK